MDGIRRTRADLRELELFVAVSANAFSKAESALAQIDLVERINAFLGEAGRFKTPEERERAEIHAKEIQSFALDQRASGFSYLYTLAAVRLWGIIEACVDDLVAGALTTIEECKDRDLLFRLKGPLLEFRSASADEQAEFLAELLKSAVDATLKLGAGRFEALLDPCGLGGGLDDQVRRVLLELSQVRNLVVHKSGRVDRRLLEQCPWLRHTLGEALHTSATDFGIYSSGVYWYLMELARRVRRRRGEAEDQELENILGSLLESVRTAWDTREKMSDPA